MNMNSFCRTCNKPLPEDQYFCNDECQNKYWSGSKIKKPMTTDELVAGFKRLAENAPPPSPEEQKEKTIEDMTSDEVWESLNGPMF